MFFKHKPHDGPVRRGFYAVMGGTYGGEFLVYIKENKDLYTFISLPEKKVLDVPKDAFKRGIDNKILDFIDTLPKRVFYTVENEYKQLNKINGTSTTKTNHKPDKRAPSDAQASYNQKR